MKTLLSPRDLARAIGVSESSLKRWADQGLIQVARTAGGHRRIAVSDAIRFIRESGTPVLRPDLLGLNLPTPQSPSADPTPPAELFYRLLVEGQGNEAGAWLIDRYINGVEVEALCDGPVREALARVGELWQGDFDDGVMREHRATDVCVSALNQLRLAVEPKDASLLAIGGAPSDDPYLIPSVMAATVIASKGVRTVNLGPQSPITVLVRAVRSHAAAFAWLSLSSDVGEARRADEISALADALRGLGATLIVGGRALPALRPTLPNVIYGASMGELAAFVRGRLAAG